jgi:hypothetical protein
MNSRLTIWIILSLLMVATRFGHMGGPWSLPDASWAIFFVGGYYLARQWRWALPSLIVLAVSIDLIAINHFGVSNYCLTVAYGFNVPAYAVLWLGGRWLQRHSTQTMLDLIRLSSSVLCAESLCYLITNGSFYWLGGRIVAPTMDGWLKNLGDWYLPYLINTLIYVGIACVAQLAFSRRVSSGERAAGARNA